MGEAYTKNPYTRGSANFEKVQKQIDSNSNTKSLITPPSEVTSALEIIDKPTGRSKGFRGSGGRNFPTEQQAVVSQVNAIDPISEIQQVKPASPIQQKIKSIGNLTLGTSNLNLGLGPQSLKLTPQQQFLTKQSVLNQPTSEMTPAELAIRQGNVSALAAQTLRDKNLITPGAIGQQQSNIKLSNINIKQNLGLTNKNVKVIETKKGTFYDFGQGYANETAFKQYKTTGTWNNDTQFLTKKEVISGRVSQVQELSRQKQIASTQSEEQTFQALGQFFAGGGSQITGLGTNILSRGAGKLALGASSAIKLFTPASKATNIVASGAKPIVGGATKQVTKDGIKFVASQAASATGYILSSQAPETARNIYDAQNPESTKDFADLRNTPEYKQAVGDSFISAQVNTYGGKQQDQTGKIVDIPSTTNLAENFLATNLPFTRSANPTFVANFDFKDRAKTIPGYDKLSPKQKQAFVESTILREVTYANTYGGAAQTLGTEMSSEIGASGLNKLLFNKISGGITGGATKQAVTKALLVTPYAGAEGFSQVYNEASAEQRTAKPEDLFLGTVAGVGTGAFFAAAPTYLRGFTNEGAGGIINTGAKRSIKSQVKSGARKGVAQVIETGGFILDLAEKPGDILASPFKRALGVNTITITNSGVATPANSASDSASNINNKKSDFKPKGKNISMVTDVSTGTIILTNTNTKTKSPANTPANTLIKSNTKNNANANIISSTGTNILSNANTNIDSDANTNIDSDSIIDITTNTDTNTNTDTDIFTNTNTNTNTETQINTSVPVISFPGAPPLFGGAVGMSGSRGPSKRGLKVKNVTKLSSLFFSSRNVPRQQAQRQTTSFFSNKTRITQKPVAKPRAKQTNFMFSSNNTKKPKGKIELFNYSNTKKKKSNKKHRLF